ncbi:MAG: manganese efflux pump [Candidatus Eremiobacteraeota bacterium]|nr:manganese efflux pump [Candidatus Eremiobacteraeota bacterium]
MTAAIAKIVVLAISLALDVFAVCVGVGVRGRGERDRLRIGIAFGSAEVSMNLIGAGLGRVIGHFIGEAAAYLGFAALVGVGIYMVFESFREETGQLDLSSGWGLLLAAISISLDSLGVGFTLPYLGLNVIIALVAIFAASIVATSLGLSFGRMIGTRIGGATGLIAGVLLALTGVVFAIARSQGI